jgi:DNA-binding response OmpR family regulator
VKLLVVEDEPKVARALQSGLSEERFVVDVAADGEEGEFMASTSHYDAIVLDVMLPKIDGLEVCRRLREAGIHTPILMLTARDTTADKIVGLDCGADDYLTKPFAFDELLARLRALLRRGPVVAPEVLTYENVAVDTVGHTVAVGGRPVELTAREYALLEHFIRNPGRICSRHQLAEHAWGSSYDPFSNVVDVYVTYLRKKIDTEPDFKLIHTVRGLGYLFKRKPRTGA